MKIRQLQCFVVLAEELNFTRAAKRLNMSQPPLSLQLQSLEREVGTELLDRASRPMSLTRAGKAFLQRARNMLAQHQRALQEIREIQSGQHGALDIGTTGSTLRAGLADLLARFCKVYPAITIRLHEQSPALQTSDLVTGRMDVIFNRSAPAHDALTCELIWREELMVVLPTDHPLANRPVISIRDLRRDRHIILRPDSSDFAAFVLSLMTREGFHPRISQQVIDAQSIPSLVAAGFGISIVPAGIAKFTAGPIVFRPIGPQPPMSEIFAVYSRDQQTPALDTLLIAARAWTNASEDTTAAI